jgi:type I restriction enzyme, S subunit
MNAEDLLKHFDRIAEAPDAVAHLRRFILDLAVRGKLVEQDPNDEPASELLRRIQAEKERLVQTGEIKKIERFEQSELTDLQFAAPTGWQILPMGWLARKLGAGSTPLGGKSVYQNEGIPFLRSQNVHNDGLRLDDVALIPESVHNRMSGTHIKEDDILLNITGASIGRCSLVPNSFKEGNVSQHVAIIRLFRPEMREFIHLSLISPFFQKLIDNVQVGVSREGLSMQSLKLFPMLIPPIAEQHRIVAKVDELMGLCDRLQSAQQNRESQRDRLVAASLHHLNQSADGEFGDRARFYFNHLSELTGRSEHIRELRQTILNLAVRGKLVPQDPNDEPASKSLMLVQKNKTGRDWIGKTDAKVFEEFSPPSGWIWTQIASAVERVTVGFVGSMKQHYVSEGIPFLRSQNVRANRFRPEGIVYISQSFHKSIIKSALCPGDVVVVRSGNVGTACVIPPCFSEANCSDLVVIKKPLAVVPDFLCFYLNSLASLYVKNRTVGIALTHFNTKSVAIMPIPLPPLAEQHRIIAKVDELMGLCDRLETQLTTTQTTSRQLLESLLHKALIPSI